MYYQADQDYAREEAYRESNRKAVKEFERETPREVNDETQEG